MQTTPWQGRARRFATVLIAAAVAASAAVQLTSTATAQAPSDTAGVDELGQDRDVAARFERWATITKIPLGLYYDAGQQNTHLVVTEVKNGLRYFDRRTDVLRSKPDRCDRKRSKVGLVVVCRVPSDVSARNPLRVKVFTRLGDDTVDTSALSRAYRQYGLADQGNDTFIGGDGNDFVNGAPGIDRVYGGAGNDLLRGGLNHDFVSGGRGNDKLSGLEGPDKLRGGSGRDRIGGHEGDDTLYAGPGLDQVLCYTGRDIAFLQREDRVVEADCERIRYV